MKTRLSLAALLLCASAFAQISDPTGTFNTALMILPVAVPASPTAIYSSDAQIMQVSIANTTGGALTFTLSDKQASPIDIMTAVSIAANTTYVITWPKGYYAKGGFTAGASGSGLVWAVKWMRQ